MRRVVVRMHACSRESIQQSCTPPIRIGRSGHEGVVSGDAMRELRVVGRGCIHAGGQLSDMGSGGGGSHSCSGL